MPNFIWKAKDSLGNAVVRKVEAENAKASKEILIAEGLTDLLLQQDELSAASKAASRAAGSQNVPPPLFTPEQEAEHFEGKFPGFWLEWAKTFTQPSKSVLLWILLLAYGIYRGNTFLTILPAVLCILHLLPNILFPFFYFWLGKASRLYKEVNRAKVWSRWSEVYRLSEELEKTSGKGAAGVPKWENARNKAMALAGMNRLDDGLKLFTPLENDPTLEHWMFLSFKAAIYDVAKQHDKSLELRKQAAEEKPDNMNTLIDLAMHYARRTHDLENAKAVAARIDKSLVTELGLPYLEVLDGVILQLENQYSASIDKLESALTGFVKYQHAPLIEAIVLITKSHLCLANANTGNQSKARELWKQVQPYLVGTRDNDMLGRIQTALQMNYVSQS